MDKTELKPCPFCGSRRVSLDHEDIGVGMTFFVSCDPCGARGPFGTASYGEGWALREVDDPEPTERDRAVRYAIDSWNERS